MSPAIATRWDILEEHLDEAAFLQGMWERALRAPQYSLSQIAEGPEARMLAHLDGLVVGGPPVAERLLLPALRTEEPGVAFAAAFALVEGNPDHVSAVLSALDPAKAAPAAALLRALALAPSPELDQRLLAVLPRAGNKQLQLLEPFAYRRLDPGLRLEALVASSEPNQQALGFRVAGLLPGRLDPSAWKDGLSSPEAVVRGAALRSGMVLGIRGTFASAEAIVSGREPGFETAALLLGLSGDEKSVLALVPALADDSVATAAAFALGFSGRTSAANALLEAMRDDGVAPAAAEGFAAITGLKLDKRLTRRPKPWNPGDIEEDEPAKLGPEADLPHPEAEAVAAWWATARQKLDPSQRWVRGGIWNAEAVLGELEQGSARRRDALALDLAVRTRGQARLAWDALSARQRKELAELHSLASRVSPKAYRDA